MLKYDVSDLRDFTIKNWSSNKDMLNVTTNKLAKLKFPVNTMHICNKICKEINIFKDIQGCQSSFVFHLNHKPSNSYTSYWKEKQKG